MVKLTHLSMALLPTPVRERLIRRLISNPYKEENDKIEAIFVHVPKCAGVSVEEAVFGVKVGHVPLRNFQYYDNEKFSRYYKFSFVRNPWDRLVSAYHFLKAGGRNPHDAQWAEQSLSAFDTFDAFVRALEKKQARQQILGWQHFRPQVDFITDCSGRINLDFLGYFESLHEDIHHVSEALNLSVELPHKNKSNRSKRFQDYYSDQTANIVHQVYKDDVERLGYSFDG